MQKNHRRMRRIFFSHENVPKFRYIFIPEKFRDLVAGAGDTNEFVCIGVCRNLPVAFAVAPIDLAGIA